MCQSRVLPSHLLRFQSPFILFLSYLGLTVRLIIALFSVANIESSKSCAYMCLLDILSLVLGANT